jgi:hypothetical protein
VARGANTVDAALVQGGARVVDNQLRITPSQYADKRIEMSMKMRERTPAWRAYFRAEVLQVGFYDLCKLIYGDINLGRRPYGSMSDSDEYRPVDVENEVVTERRVDLLIQMGKMIGLSLNGDRAHDEPILQLLLKENGTILTKDRTAFSTRERFQEALRENEFGSIDKFIASAGYLEGDCATWDQRSSQEAEWEFVRPIGDGKAEVLNRGYMNHDYNPDLADDLQVGRDEHKTVPLLELLRYRKDPALTPEESAELRQTLKDQGSYQDLDRMRRAMKLAKKLFLNLLSTGDPKNLRAKAENVLRVIDDNIEKLNREQAG